MPSTRRAFLAALSTGTAAVAGCSSSCPDSDPPTPETVLGPAAEDGDGFDTPPAGSWPAPRGDAANTGYVTGDVPDAPTVRWRTRLPGASDGSSGRSAEGTEGTEGAAADGASAPVVADGTAFVATGAGAVALALRDGSERWHVEAFAPATTGAFEERPVPPRATDRRVYFASVDALVALDPAEGTELWRREVTAVDTPAVADGTVVVPTAGGLLALDPADGSERWTASLGDGARHPAIVDGTVVAAGRELAAFDAADGGERWRLDLRAAGRPAVADGTAYLGTDEGIVAVGVDDGTRRWTVERGSGRSYSTPVVTPETAYAVERPVEAGDATFAFDRGGGTPSPRWCSEAGDGAVTAATDDHALAIQPIAGDGYGSGGLVAFTARFGEATWGYAPSEGPRPPAVLDGAAVVVDHTGTVAALGGGNA